MYKILYIPTGSFLYTAVPHNKCFNEILVFNTSIIKSKFYKISIAEFESPEYALDALEEFMDTLTIKITQEEFEVMYV